MIEYSWTSPQQSLWGQKKVVVTERWMLYREREGSKQESMYGLSAKKSGCLQRGDCSGGVAISGGWTVHC